MHVDVTHHTSLVARHTSHVTRHTSHVTRHTSHITRHTSHVTRHTSHVTRHTSRCSAIDLNPVQCVAHRRIVAQYEQRHNRHAKNITRQSIRVWGFAKTADTAQGLTHMCKCSMSRASQYTENSSGSTWTQSAIGGARVPARHMSHVT